MSVPALAYGPEGLFGGRFEPDSSVPYVVSVQPETRPERAQSVLQHPRPDFDPVPHSLGAFDLYPALETGLSYDSNIYARPTNKADDGVINLRPAVSAFSNWNRHALTMMAFGDVGLHGDRSRENYQNAVVEVQGRYDVSNQTWLTARGAAEHLTETRSSPNAAGGSEPTTFDVFKGGISAYRGVGKIKTGADYNIRRFAYDNTPSSLGVIDQSGRNRNEHKVEGKVGYSLTENLQPYVRASYNRRNYDRNTARSSKGYDAVMGAIVDLGGITSLEAYIGWLAQDYAHFGAGKINDGVKFGGKFEWNVTGLTTLALEANRTVEETTSIAYSSFMATGGSATLTHELLRNVLLEGHAAFTRDDYNGNGNRQDDNLRAGAGTRWLINRTLYSDVVYSWERRLSNLGAAEYNRHIGSVRFGVQM